MTLAVAEEALAFEHRDLHWGNLLLLPACSLTIDYRLRGMDITVQTQGAQVTLIDFTASRLQTSSGDVAFCDLELDPEIFDGPKGNFQCDTYRRMRQHTGKDWKAFYPGTNVLWMQYLADTLLTKKDLPGISAAQKRCLREFKKRALQYANCGEMIWDELFRGLWFTKTE